MKLAIRHFSLALPAAIAAAVVLAPRSASALADPEMFGVCEHVSIRTDNFGGEFQRRDTVLSGLRAAGIRWVRTDFRWMGCTWPWETAGEYNWYDFDCVFDSAAAHGVSILPILIGDNPWTGAKAFNDLDGWCEFVRLFVTRYKDRISAVEIWNEPNMANAWSGTAAQYVTLLQRSYAAVKAVDSSIRVVLGGLSGDPSDDLDDLYSAGAQGAFDVMNFHPYNGQRAPAAEWETSSGFLGLSKTTQSIPIWIDRVRAKMNSNGDSGKPIWITEIGWYTAGASGAVSEAAQAEYVAALVPLAVSKGVEKLFIYEFRAPEVALDTNQEESHFGIVHADFSPKPAYLAYRNAIYEAVHGAADPDAGAVFLVAADGWGVQSASVAGGWLDGAAPHADADYIVALGEEPGLWTTNGPVETVFAGRSLTLGQANGGTAGMLRLLGWGSTFAVPDLRLNGGSCRLTGSTGTLGETLAGAVSVRTTASRPFAFRADPDGTRGFTLVATLTGASGTAIAAEAAANATLDISVTGGASAYAGQYQVNGAAVTARFAAAALAGPSGAGAIVLRDGAALAPLVDGQVFSTARALSSADGTARIDVPAGQTFTLAAPLSGVFLKTGDGTLVLDGDITGDGRIAVAQGEVRVDMDTAQFVSAIDGGRVVYCVPAGSLSSAQSIATVTVPGPVSAGAVAVSDGAAPVGWTASVHYETAEGGDVTAYIDVAADGHTTLGADSFEAFAVGTAADQLPGWSGDGRVAAGAPDIGNPPGVPLPDETHARLLALDGNDATRAYADAFARDNQSFDMLVRVTAAADSDWRDRIDDDPSAQLRLAFDEGGHPWALHGDSGGGRVWSRLVGARADSPVFLSGTWLRVSIDFDYTSAAPTAYAQIRIEGQTLQAEDGAPSPGASPTGGSWLRLPAAATAARKVASVSFRETLAVDDLVHRYHAAGTPPDFAAFGGTDLGGIPRSWFDSFGVARDPGADPDGDGYANLREWRKGTDPSDPFSHPPAGTFLLLQ